MVTVLADPAVEVGGWDHGTREEEQAGKGGGEGQSEGDEADCLSSLEDAVPDGRDVDGLGEIVCIEQDGGGGRGGGGEEEVGCLMRGLGEGGLSDAGKAF